MWFDNKTNYGYADDEDEGDNLFNANNGFGGERRAARIRANLAKDHKDDQYFYQVKQKLPNTSKTVAIGIFGSGDTGSFVRDAVTGERYRQHKVGSAYEDLYFKVGIHTGEFGKNTPSFFFDSPEDYERHMFVRVSDEVKQRWRRKFYAARERYAL
jgi:hypothetical protein